MPDPGCDELQSDRKLLKALLTSEPGAEDRFIKKHMPDIRRAVGKVSWDRTLVDDLVQETLLVLRSDSYARLQKWTGRASFSAFVQVVVQNIARDLQRLSRYRPWDHPNNDSDLKVEDESSASYPLRYLLAEEIAFAVRRCLETLTVSERTLVHRRHFRDEQPAEIAQLEGRTAGSISVALTRALGKLKQCLQSKFPDVVSGALFYEHETL